MLNTDELAILKELVESSSKEIHVVKNAAFIGNSRYSQDIVRKFLSATAIREVETLNGITRYELTSTGRLINADPEAANQIAYATGANYGSFF